MNLEKLIVGQLQTNCYLFYSCQNRNCFIIDPGDDADFIINRIKDLKLQPKAILATHGHFDHVLAATELKMAFNIPFYLNKKDIKILKRIGRTAEYFTGIKADPPSLPENFFFKARQLRTKGLLLEIIETPGHTPGSVCFYCPAKNICFTGDLIFSQGGYGRTDLEGGSQKQLKESINRILKLPAETIIYPGHGKSSVLKKEKKYYNFD